ncbi:MAG: hypothetical protein JRI55_41180 [Deltaproteobacteria bacterium]|jgi:hypothetical protein|nr:hypothetical protein [Deltaproteobacteria bacterium]
MLPTYRQVLAPFYPRLQFVDKSGARFTPTFLPPPMPRPGGPRRRRIGLGRHQFTLLGGVSTFSGFTRSDGKGRVYPMLPAGKYEVRAEVAVAGVKGKVRSNPATLVVARSDTPADGLQLALGVRGGRVRASRTVQLDITFANVGVMLQKNTIAGHER